MTNKSWLLSPVVVLAVGLTACSGGDEPTGPPVTNPLDGFLGESTVDFTIKGGTTVLLESGNPFKGQLRWDEQEERKAQDAIADCMADQGFDYVPFVQEQVLEKLPDLDDEEFVKTYGYGFTVFEFGGQDKEVNPNIEIRESLPKSAQAEYDLALDGEGDQQGCQGKGLDEATQDDTDGTPAPRPDMAEFAALEGDLQTLGDRIQNDRRLDEPRNAWADCMAQAGYPGLKELWETGNLIEERMNQIPGYEEWMNKVIDEEDGSYAPGSFDVDPATYQDLLDFEIAVATADRDCLVEHYNDTFEEVRRDLEADFVESHRDQLESYRDQFASE